MNPTSYRRTILTTSMLMALAVTCAQHAVAFEVEGFTEPYRQIAIPASETGVIAEILVEEGDEVSKSQLLARLDDRVLKASLEVARAAKDSTGTHRGAEAELEVREKQLAGYRDLHANNNASQREIDRAEGDYQQAAARLQSVREELELRRLEFERVKTQIAQRRIESPINGYVVALVKEVGEFVSPTDPIVMHIVQLDEFKVVFSVPIPLAANLRQGQAAKLFVGSHRQRCAGVIEFVSPVADAQSGSVRVKVWIANAGGAIQSGAPCIWDLDSNIDSPGEKLTRRRGNGVR